MPTQTVDCALPAGSGKRAAAVLRACLAAAVVSFALAVGGCASVRFYTQAIAGQASVLLARQDTAALIDDPGTDPALVRQLRLLSRILRYAEDELHLPVGGRYRSYVELDGVPVWNVVAAPEFDVAPIRRCYPLLGCAVYRGYFSERDASREADRLAIEHDVHLYGVTAYSTLGWFDDPILSSFVHYDEAALADLVFHELGHSVVYVAGESAFNEAFAGFVGNEGAIRWLGANGGDGQVYRDRLESAKAYARFLAGWRTRMADLYREPVSDAAKRQLKHALFAAMRASYERDRERLGGGGYDSAMAQPFNNARLALVATYEDSKADFERLFNEVGGDWRAFHAAVKELASLPEDERWTNGPDHGLRARTPE